LLHTAGIEARGDFRPQLDADIFTMWNAAGAELRAVLKREGRQIILRIAGPARRLGDRYRQCGAPRGRRFPYSSLTIPKHLVNKKPV